tara:strand:- start:146 stop:268 length:123 start_codon:yes stop_codon:yes gene_type:complete
MAIISKVSFYIKNALVVLNDENRPLVMVSFGFDSRRGHHN